MRCKAGRAGLSGLAFAALAGAVLVSGCVSLRPHDDQRLEVAKEAVQVAQGLRQPETDPFAAMEANVEAVFEAWEKVTAIQTQDREDTFYAVLPEMTRDDLHGRVASTLDLHLTILDQADREVRGATADVRRQLERQALLNEKLGAPADSRLETVLTAVENRIAWLQGLQTDIARALEAVGRLAPGTTRGTSNDEQLQRARELTDQLGGNLEAVQSFIGEIQNDPQVAAAGQLLLRSGQEVAQAEQERLAQMRRFLKTVEQKRDALDRRNLLYFRSLMIPALGAVATVNQYSQALEKIQDSTSKRIQSRAPESQESVTPNCDAVVQPSPDHELFCFVELQWADPADSNDADPNDADSKKLIGKITEALQKRQQLWCPSCRLVDFVNASIAAQKQATAAAPPATCAGCSEAEADDPASFSQPATQGVDAMKNLIASVGILLFVEEPADRKVALDLAKERHLHSIQLSRINSQERLDLVGQVAEALRIYYQGGLTPAEAAQAILLASQVLSLAFIGSQV